MEKAKRNDFKNLCIGFGVIILYLVLSSLSYEFIGLFGINFNKLNYILKTIYMISYEAIITLIIIYIYRKNFIPNFKDFIKNFKVYIDKYIKYWFLMLGLMLLSNSIITNFTSSEIAENQEAIVSLLGSFPIYTIVITVLIAPFMEELVFRLSFRKIFAHTNFIYILFSGLFFGAMHVIGSFESLYDLLFIIPYSIPGFIFAYIYTKTNNICIPISLHMLHNSVMVILQLILIFLI